MQILGFEEYVHVLIHVHTCMGIACLSLVMGEAACTHMIVM